MAIEELKESGEFGIELAEKIKKSQFKTGKLGGATAPAPEIW